MPTNVLPCWIFKVDCINRMGRLILPFRFVAAGLLISVKFFSPVWKLITVCFWKILKKLFQWNLLYVHLMNLSRFIPLLVTWKFLEQSIRMNEFIDENVLGTVRQTPTTAKVELQKPSTKWSRQEFSTSTMQIVFREVINHESFWKRMTISCQRSSPLQLMRVDGFSKKNQEVQVKFPKFNLTRDSCRHQMNFRNWNVSRMNVTRETAIVFLIFYSRVVPQVWTSSFRPKKNLDEKKGVLRHNRLLIYLCNNRPVSMRSHCQSTKCLLQTAAG